MNLDDPKLTAFALDELGEPERSIIARSVAKSPEAQRFVDETRELARALKVELAADLEKGTDAPAPVPTNLIDIRDDPWFWSVARPLAIAAGVALCAILASVAIFSPRHGSQRSSGTDPLLTEIEGEAEPSKTQGTNVGTDHVGENPFLNAKSYPFSAFPLRVDTDSYSNVRRFINDGSMPPKDAVQVEELINYFTYNYAAPQGDKAFALHVDVSNCPWESTHRLVRIGVKACEEGARSVTVAKDAKIQIEFNPEFVASYRLIGYEKRIGPKQESTNEDARASEIGAGRTVTALYEVMPVQAVNPAVSMPRGDALGYSPNERSRLSGSTSPEMLTVRLRYKKPEREESEFIQRALVDNGAKFENAAADLKFAAAVAEFGMLLRDSEYKGNGTFGAVLEWAQEGKGDDPNGYRAGFIELVRRAQMLKRG